MHRSAYKFGISLMASLIVLSTVTATIPMGNMNIFQDALASGKHSDRYDNYKEYEKSYYSDDNQYTSEYNYYYEPMKQQQSSYDNNYNYDDKKISYSDSYEDMKKYSTYPTKDKKYVCQTGQFQGFYVESVEFCKLKIAQGPAGLQSPAGIINAELCPAGTDLENVYVLNGTTAESCNIIATCEKCFEQFLTEKELDDLIQAIIEDGGPDSLQGLCDFIANSLDNLGRAFISDRLFVLGEDVEISEDKINEILDCLEEVFGGDFPREINGPLTAQQMNWKS